jgi:hypothetical protein
MLEAAGLQAAPVLVSLTLPVDEEFPNPLQFNHVLVGIPVAGLGDVRAYSDAVSEGWLFFDPSAEEMTVGGLSSALQGRLGLVCTRTGGHLVRLPTLSPARTYRRGYEVNAHLMDDGSVTAEVWVTDQGYEAAYVSLLRARTPVEEQIEYWKRRIYPNAPALTVTNFQYAPDPDSGWVRFRVDMPGYATGTDSVRLLNLDFLHPAEPPELLPGDREHPVVMGSRHLTTGTITWRLPAGWGAAVERPSGNAVCKAGWLRYRLTPLRAGELKLEWEIELSGQTMEPSDYDRAVAFSREASNLRCLTVKLGRTGEGE